MYGVHTFITVDPRFDRTGRGSCQGELVYPTRTVPYGGRKPFPLGQRLTAFVHDVLNEAVGVKRCDVYPCVSAMAGARSVLRCTMALAPSGGNGESQACRAAMVRSAGRRASSRPGVDEVFGYLDVVRKGVAVQRFVDAGAQEAEPAPGSASVIRSDVVPAGPGWDVDTDDAGSRELVPAILFGPTRVVPPSFARIGGTTKGRVSLPRPFSR